MAVVTIMERPETVALTYDKANPMAKKALDFFLSLGVFLVLRTFLQHPPNYLIINSIFAILGVAKIFYVCQRGQKQVWEC